MSDNPFADTKILLVEDEESLAIGLEFNLSEEGFQVTLARDGREALSLFNKSRFELVILDIMLPFVDGFEVARQIREKDAQLPILMLTARTAIGDRISGLEAGADDYITKPFHLEELLLRVKGMLKRKSWYKTASRQIPEFTFGPNRVNFNTLTASSSKAEFKLTVREGMLLKYLIENKGRIVSRRELLENVWNIYSEIETRTVDNFIMRLRKYFELNPEKPRFIKSVRGAGYIFEEQPQD